MSEPAPLGLRGPQEEATAPGCLIMHRPPMALAMGRNPRQRWGAGHLRSKKPRPFLGHVSWTRSAANGQT